MSDNTINLLTEEARQLDWDQLSSNIANAIKQINELAGAAKEVKFTISGDESLINFINRSKVVEDSIASTDNALKNLTRQFENLNATSKEYGNITTNLIQKQAEYKVGIFENEKEISNLKKTISSAQENLDRFSKAGGNNKDLMNAWNESITQGTLKIKQLEVSIIKAKVEMSALNPEITAAVKGFRSQVGAIDELDARVKILTGDFNALSPAMRDSVGGKRLQEDIQSLNIELTELRAGLRGVGTEEKELSLLRQKELVLKSKIIALNSEEAKSVAALNIEVSEQNKINKLNAIINDEDAGARARALAQVKLWELELNNLKNAEGEEAAALRDNINAKNQFIKATSSQSAQQKLTIGDYKNARAELTLTKEAMMELIIEGKELSSEYLLLESRAKQLVIAQNKVNESIKEGETVVQRFFRGFTSQIFRFVGSLIIWQVVVGLFTDLYEKITKTDEASVKARESLDAYNTSIKNVSRNVLDNIDKENELTKQLLESSKNLSLSYDYRLDSINKLIQMYPDLLSSLDKEDMLLGRLSNRDKEKIDKAVITKAAVDSSEKLIEETKKRRDDLQADIDKFEANKARGFFGGNSPLTMLGLNNAEDVNEQNKKDLEKAKKDIEDYRKTRDAFSQQYELLIHPTHEKNVNDYREDLKNLKLSIDAMGLPKEITELIEGKTDDPKGGKLRKLLKDSNSSDFIKEVERKRNEYKTLETQIKILEGEQDGKDGSSGNRTTPLDLKRSANDRLLRAEEESRRLELDRIVINEKAISDDIKYELNQRLIANGVYHNTKQQQDIESYSKEILIKDSDMSDSIKRELEYQKRLEELKSGKGKYSISARQALVDKTNNDIEFERTTQKAIQIERLNLQKKFNDSAVQQQVENSKDIKKIENTSALEFINKKEEEFAELKTHELTGYLNQTRLLKQFLDDKLITRKEYDKRIDALDKNQRDSTIQSAINMYKGLLDSQEVYGYLTEKQEREIWDKINALTKQQIDNAFKDKDPKKKKDSDSWRPTDILVDMLSSQKLKDNDQKLLEAKKEFWDKTVELAKTAFDTINTIKNNAFQQEQLQISIQERSVQTQSQQKIQAIEASTGYSITNKNKESLVAAQAAAKEQELQNKSNQLALKQAIANKEASELSIIGKTAEGVMNVWAKWAAEPPIAIALSGLVTGIGAAEYAAAASAPLPQFWTGGTTETPVFSAGEKGFEFGVTPSGKLISFPKNDIYSAPIGTNIFSNEKSTDLIEQAVYNVYAKQPNQSKYGDNLAKDVAKELSLIIGSKFESVGDGIEYAIYKSKPYIQIVNKSSDRLTYSVNRRKNG